MSSVKSPKDKKKLSLERDRRNTFGENAKSSRKNIPKSKRLSQRAIRRAAKVPLESAVGAVSEDVIVAAESEMRSAMAKKRGAAFAKIPDKPLGAVLEEKARTKATSWKSLRAVASWGKPKR